MDKVIDLPPCPHIHAPCGFVKDEYFRGGIETFGDGGFLLIAAAEVFDLLGGGAALHPEGAYIVQSFGADGFEIKESASGIGFLGGKSHIDINGELKEKSAPLAVFGEEGDLVLQGILHLTDLHLFAVDPDGA